jgi:hypothetical protein
LLHKYDLDEVWKTCAIESWESIEDFYDDVKTRVKEERMREISQSKKSPSRSLYDDVKTSVASKFDYKAYVDDKYNALWRFCKNDSKTKLKHF